MAGSRLYSLCVNIPEHSPNGLYDFTSYPWRDREGTYTTPWYLNIVDICCNAGCISPNLWLEPFSSSIPNYKILIHGFHLIPAEIILWMDGWRKTTPNSNRRILHIYSSRGIRFPISCLNPFAWWPTLPRSAPFESLLDLLHRDRTAQLCYVFDSAPNPWESYTSGWVMQVFTYHGKIIVPIDVTVSFFYPSKKSNLDRGLPWTTKCKMFPNRTRNTVILILGLP